MIPLKGGCLKGKALIFTGKNPSGFLPAGFCLVWFYFIN